MRIFGFLLLFLPLIISAQSRISKFSFEREAVVNMTDQTEDWHIHLQHLEAPAPGSNSLRAQLREKKERIMQRFPRISGTSTRGGGVPIPVVGTNFEGNSFQGVPNDNDLAISNDSMLVSVTNSKVFFFNAVTQEHLLTRSLSNMAQPLSVAGNKFDPKVIFDPIADRFVMVFLNGSTWGTSWIVIGFSQTNDPTGDWNMYKIYGNPLSNMTWSDYPVIGFSSTDLYIGINTFTNGSTNNSGFVESCLWQIGLSEGYAGSELITNYFSDILPQTKELFNITPMNGGIAPYGPNMYLLSNRNSDATNDTVFLLEVTGPVTDQNTELVVKTITADVPYILPVPARQAEGHWFDTNDSRVLGGYYHNGKIQFVQSCTDTLTGTSAIYNGTIADPGESDPSVSSRIISEVELDFGYPNISCSGLTEADEQAIITFNHSSETVPAGYSAVFLNAAMESSDRVLIKEGSSHVNVMSDSIERWGDYSGSQPLYDDLGTVWAVGSFGLADNGHGTWITELKTPDRSAGIASQGNAVITHLYPNPFMDLMSVEFEMSEATFVRLELMDASGKLVKLLLEDRIKQGANRLTFSGAFLPTGNYFVRAVANDGILFSKTVIKL